MATYYVIPLSSHCPIAFQFQSALAKWPTPYLGYCRPHRFQKTRQKWIFCHWNQDETIFSLWRCKVETRKGEKQERLPHKLNLSCSQLSKQKYRRCQCKSLVSLEIRQPILFTFFHQNHREKRAISSRKYHKMKKSTIDFTSRLVCICKPILTISFARVLKMQLFYKLQRWIKRVGFMTRRLPNVFLSEPSMHRPIYHGRKKINASLIFLRGNLPFPVRDSTTIWRCAWNGEEKNNDSAVGFHVFPSLRAGKLFSFCQKNSQHFT